MATIKKIRELREQIAKLEDIPEKQRGFKIKQKLEDLKQVLAKLEEGKQVTMNWRAGLGPQAGDEVKDKFGRPIKY